MFVITDKNGVIVDMASRRENLSRGYDYPGHIFIAELDESDVRIGDSYKNEKLTRNVANRVKQEQRRSDEAKITARARGLAIQDLKSKGELPADYE